MQGIYLSIGQAFATMAPIAVFIGLCERVIGMLVNAVRGGGGLM